jgi:DNA polymerase III alpha subunit
MDFNILPLIKSHYSINRSIITTNKPKGNLEKYPISAFDLVIQNKIDTLIMVEDSVSSLMELSQNAKDNNIKLIFGLRLSVCEDINDKGDDFFKKTAKYIIFGKNSQSYKDIIKISTFANTKGFNKIPRIDWINLKKLWTTNLIFCVPFYDSFLHLNSLESHSHSPDFSFIKPIFFLEDNDIPFDQILEKRINNYCKQNNFKTIKAQTIYYPKLEDFLAYQTFRCIGNRSGANKATLESPELNHFCSNTFNFERWLRNNKNG